VDQPCSSGGKSAFQEIRRSHVPDHVTIRKGGVESSLLKWSVLSWMDSDGLDSATNDSDPEYLGVGW